MRFSLTRKSGNLSTHSKKPAKSRDSRALIEPLEQRQLLSGTVTGLITDAASNPLSDARVRLVPESKGAQPYFATTDSSGDYVINNVADGLYLVKARDQGFVPNASAQFTVADGTNIPPTVELTAIVTGTVSGQVTDSNGTPLADAVVHLVLSSVLPGGTPPASPLNVLPDLQKNFIHGRGYGLTATTDSSGDYVINNVLGGSYYVRANDTGYTSNTTAAFTVAAGSNTAPTVQLFAIVFGTVSGQITDSSGNPLAGAQVDLFTNITAGNGIASGPTHFKATTDSNGDYGFDNVLAGTYTVLASAKGYTPNESAQFTVVAGSNTAPTVEIAKIIQGTLTGQVTDNQGNPLANVFVNVAPSPEGGPMYFAKTDSNGDYTIKNVLAGAYKVTASDNGYTSSGSTSITVVAGANTVPTIQLTPIVYATVTGEITDNNGNPLADAIVYVLVQGTPFPMPETDAGGLVHRNPPDFVRVGTTNASGQYTLTMVPTGTYMIGAHAKDFLDNTSAAFTVVAGSNTAPTVALTPKPSTTA